MSASAQAEDLAYITGAWGPRVGAVAGAIFRHPNRTVPADLLKELSDELAAAAGEVQDHPRYRKFQQALRIRHNEALKRVCRAKRPSPKPMPEAATIVADDGRCGQGAIGGVSLEHGCYSFYETWNLAIPNIVQRGLRDEVLAKLASGVTVRLLLRRM